MSKSRQYWAEMNLPPKGMNPFGKEGKGFRSTVSFLIKAMLFLWKVPSRASDAIRSALLVKSAVELPMFSNAIHFELSEASLNVARNLGVLTVKWGSADW